MPFKYVGHLEYQNALIKYRTLAGVTYEIPGSYSGAYPGSTRESQTLETDSVVISIPGAATAQQWSFQAPASSHPAFEDMFDAQEDNNPRQFQVQLAERILYEQKSPGVSVANLVIAVGVGTIAGSDVPAAEQYPVNSVFKVTTPASEQKVVGLNQPDPPDAQTDKPLFVVTTLASTAGIISKVSMPGLLYGPFLASVDEIGQADDTGVVMYAVSFTPSSVVGKPTEQIA